MHCYNVLKNDPKWKSKVMKTLRLASSSPGPSSARLDDDCLVRSIASELKRKENCDLDVSDRADLLKATEENDRISKRRLQVAEQQRLDAKRSAALRNKLYAQKLAMKHMAIDPATFPECNRSWLEQLQQSIRDGSFFNDINTDDNPTITITEDPTILPPQPQPTSTTITTDNIHPPTDD
ncbi:hypothetical protein BC941DRAFT_409763 [Chlamydoabsidia padenii]|nr:hypothetical protein BC941DRAFT_409763 [Chlamydoabsidia padenii]